MVRSSPETISIHAPREGSDSSRYSSRKPPAQFQSTLPARGATTAKILFRTASVDFNPRSPRGERRVVVSRLSPLLGNFNPRSPRGERPMVATRPPPTTEFQSTLPARGATQNRCVPYYPDPISIHAPREGSDCGGISAAALPADFNPRSPRGERRARVGTEIILHSLFQSTLPARGATLQNRDRSYQPRFQSTLPARGATIPILVYNIDSKNFNPRSPRGERPSSCACPFSSSARFQSTLPARGATGVLLRPQNALMISIHAPREGSDLHPAGFQT